MFLFVYPVFLLLLFPVLLVGVMVCYKLLCSSRRGTLSQALEALRREGCEPVQGKISLVAKAGCLKLRAERQGEDMERREQKLINRGIMRE